MAKLIGILAASVGGGLVLGASIRLGEAIGSSAARKVHGVSPPVARVPQEGSVPANARSPVNSRLDRLEERLSEISPLPAERSRTEAKQSPSASPRASAERPPEWQTALAGVVARIDRQQADVEAIQRQMSSATRALDSIGEIAGNVRDDIHRQLREELDQRLTALEENLHLTAEASRKETMNAMVASIEARVTPRISRLENDISSQSAAMTELRDCSLQSERSIQRLLTVLERVVVPKAGAAELSPEKGPVSEQANATDLPKLTVMTSREPDDPEAGGATARRPVSFRNSIL